MEIQEMPLARLPQRLGIRKVLLFLLLLCTTGCEQQIGGKLLGTWVGRPDSSEARARREAQKFSSYVDDSVDSQHPATFQNATDWESYDLEVRLSFVDQQHLEMSLANGAEAVSGTWKVIETSPTGCMIEVVTPEQSGQVSTQVRHFELEMDERGGEYVGFLLSESGADRLLGAIYFARDEN